MLYWFIFFYFVKCSYLFLVIVGVGFVKILCEIVYLDEFKKNFFLSFSLVDLIYYIMRGVFSEVGCSVIISLFIDVILGNKCVLVGFFNDEKISESYL